jgi:TP901-1 family phage major tail protein
MATAAVTGKNMTLSIEGDLMAEAQSFALHFSQASIDVTSKDSDNWGDFLAGRKEWSIDFSGLYIYNDVAKKCLQDHFVLGTPATLTVIVTMPDSATFSGEAVLESMDYEGPAEEALTISGSLKGRGTLTASVS